MSTVFYYAEDGQKHPIASNEEAIQLIHEGKIYAATWIEVEGRIYHAKSFKAWEPYFTETNAPEPSNQNFSSNEALNSNDDEFNQPVPEPPPVIVTDEELKEEENKEEENEKEKKKTNESNGATSSSSDSSTSDSFKIIQKKYGLLDIDDNELFKAVKANLPEQIKENFNFVENLNGFFTTALYLFFLLFLPALFVLLDVEFGEFEHLLLFIVLILVLLIALKLKASLRLVTTNTALLKSRDDLRQTIYLNEILKSLDKKNDETKEKE